MAGQANATRPKQSTIKLLRKVVGRLRSRYEYDLLGNLEDPLDELEYIVLSTRTRGPVFTRTFHTLKAKYPSWDRIARAKLESIEALLQPAGLSKKKARWLKLTLAEIQRREGSATLERIRAMPDPEAEEYLVSLPGVGKKTARCVLMYSLGRHVFPLDVNARRLLERLGVLSQGLHYYRVHDVAQDLVPSDIRSDLHVYAIIHGRVTCLPRNPRCEQCALLDLCPYPKEVSRQLTGGRPSPVR